MLRLSIFGICSLWVFCFFGVLVIQVITQAIQIRTIRKIDDELLNVCNPGYCQWLWFVSFSLLCLIFLIYSNLKLWCHSNGQKNGSSYDLCQCYYHALKLFLTMTQLTVEPIICFLVCKRLPDVGESIRPFFSQIWNLHSPFMDYMYTLGVDHVLG